MEKNGMTTSTWGSPGWVFLHSVAHGYPVNPDQYDTENEFEPGTTRSNYSKFFSSVGNTLPCKFCRISYNVFKKNNPIRLDSRLDLTRWLWEIHNEVNEKLGKEYDEDISFEAITKKYESFRAKCPKDKNSLGCIDPIDTEKPKKCVVIIKEVSKKEWKTHITCLLILLNMIILYKYIVYKR